MLHQKLLGDCAKENQASVFQDNKVYKQILTEHIGGKK